MSIDKLDLVSKLTKEERILQNHSLRCISPDDHVHILSPDMRVLESVKKLQ